MQSPVSLKLTEEMKSRQKGLPSLQSKGSAHRPLAEHGLPLDLYATFNPRASQGGSQCRAMKSCITALLENQRAAQYRLTLHAVFVFCTVLVLQIDTNKTKQDSFTSLPLPDGARGAEPTFAIMTLGTASSRKSHQPPQSQSLACQATKSRSPATGPG